MMLCLGGLPKHQSCGNYFYVIGQYVAGPKLCKLFAPHHCVHTHTSVRFNRHKFELCFVLKNSDCFMCVFFVQYVWTVVRENDLVRFTEKSDVGTVEEHAYRYMLQQ